MAKKVAHQQALKVGITGQTGFIGSYLYNTLGLFPEKFERIPFVDGFFENNQELEQFVSACDVIVHLAAMNRHNDPGVIYDTNIKLVKQLIVACEKTKSTPHILFASSTQEEHNNPYGRSKKEGRLLFEDWSMRNNAPFTGLIIPNVFGPFGHPYYNSVVATFCHQLTHNENPEIDVDGQLKPIYVGELVEEIIGHIDAMHDEDHDHGIVDTVTIPHSSVIRVSELLEKLTGFKTNYFEKGIIPDLDNPFDRNLFNTFVCYIDYNSFFPFHVKLKTDNRGMFAEIIKLYSGGQVSFSTTKPGITRGNHFHTRKAERFAVIKGRARIEMRRIGSDSVYSFDLDGSKPSFVDMPVWHTHNITNTGSDELYTLFWINEQYNAEDPDTYFEVV